MKEIEQKYESETEKTKEQSDIEETIKNSKQIIKAILHRNKLEIELKNTIKY